MILLTRVGESTERAMALEEGADDYLNKPFGPHELIARIRAVLRRARAGRPSLDRLSRRVYLGSEELQLTPKAATVLAWLMTHRMNCSPASVCSTPFGDGNILLARGSPTPASPNLGVR